MRDLGVQRSFWDLIERRATLTPDAVMLVDEDDRQLTFAEYRAQAEQVAAGLVAAGFPPGGRVSWQLPTTIEAAVLVAAAARLGALQNPVLPALRATEVGFIAQQVRPDLFVVPRRWRGFEHAAMAQAVAENVFVVDLDPVVRRSIAADPRDRRGLALPLGDPSDLPAPAAHGDDARWVFYSSGTTGTPKGVLHSDHTVQSTPTSLIERARLSSRDVYAMPFAITHVGGPTMLAAQLRVGFKLLLAHTFDPEATTRWLAGHGLTVLGMAPPFFQAYLAAQRRQPEALFPKARLGISGGAATPPDLHRDVRDELGGAGILTVWGMTECPIATCPDIDDDDERKAGTAGFPSAGVELRIIDSDGRAMLPGREGEILVKAPQMLLGYVDADLNSDCFTDDGFFRTGDLGSLDDEGYLRVTGRVKDVIIRNAENISAVEVETILRRHPQIADVCVLGLPDPRTGERVCAVVVPLPGSKLTPAAVLAFCRGERIATYKIPEQIAFRISLPRTSMGKVDKQVLLSDLDLRS